MQSNIRPNKGELLFLNLAYNKFFDLIEEIQNAQEFWKQDASYRFSKIKNLFVVYGEIIEYEPLKILLNNKRNRPGTHEIGKELFKFIRNYLSHFPFFEGWEEVWFQKELINWNKPGMSMDKFLTKYEGYDPFKYRIWNEKTKTMTYISVNFPLTYSMNNKIYLKDMLSEKDGITFAIHFMYRILQTQLEHT